jgi:hypothetical protein
MMSESLALPGASFSPITATIRRKSLRLYAMTPYMHFATNAITHKRGSPQHGIESWFPVLPSMIGGNTNYNLQMLMT